MQFQKLKLTIKIKKLPTRAECQQLKFDSIGRIVDSIHVIQETQKQTQY